MSKNLDQSNREILAELDRIEKDWESEKASRIQQDELLAGMQSSLKNMEEEAREQRSQMEQTQTIFKIYEMNSERLKTNLQAAQEENCDLRESEGQLLREAEGRAERLDDLSEQIRMCESSQRNMQEHCSNKDEHIQEMSKNLDQSNREILAELDRIEKDWESEKASRIQQDELLAGMQSSLKNMEEEAREQRSQMEQTLTECLLKMTDWDSKLQKEADRKDNNGKGTPENGGCLDTHQNPKVQKLLDSAKMSADLRSVVEERNWVFARLADEAKAKQDLQERIEMLQSGEVLLESENDKVLRATQKLQQKVQIMAEIHLENELRLHRRMEILNPGRKRKTGCLPDFLVRREQRKISKCEVCPTQGCVTGCPLLLHTTWDTSQ
ncbi:melanoma inhibitory activity protein 2-like [Amia ocellicauda]|uniref:melanoma inhibitory activity protein 2-like n=1 Tax=Amia ocellicauda TaxID=2972642 RepID=UPI00346396FC